MNVLLAVDVSNVYKASDSKLRHLKRSDGYSTGGLYGTLRSIHALIKRFPLGTQVVMAFDGKNGAQRRVDMDPAYKADRDRSTPFWYRDHRQDLMDVALYSGWHVVDMEGYEADDCIAAVVRAWVRDPDNNAVIMSADHDFKQLLVDHNVCIRRKADDVGHTGKDFYEEHGFGPERYWEYLALVGDASDNIQGIYTPNQAKIILASNLTWKDILEKHDEQENAVLSRNAEMVRFHDVQPVLSQEPMRTDAKLREWYARFEMNSMIKALNEGKHV